jgi:hypothetical protein
MMNWVTVMVPLQFVMLTHMTTARSQCSLIMSASMISRSIAEYLVQAWDVRNSCKHNGAVLPLPSAPEGRGADGVDAMA